MRKPANMLFLALIIAGFGSFLVYRFLNSQQAELDAARDAAKRSVETVEVVVASRSIDTGTKFTESDVILINWPKDAAPSGAIAEATEVIGKIARHNFVKFQPIAREHLTDHRSGLMPLLIESGKRAISVRVDKETGVSGFITPNSYVDVLATGTVVGGAGERQQHAKLIIQNVKVMAIGQSIEILDDEPVEVPTVTLLVTPEEAEKVTLATQQKPVRLALRHFEDDESVVTPGTSMNQLLERNGAALPLVRVAGGAPRKSMEVYLGETMVRVPY